jgi:hypothetical protein
VAAPEPVAPGVYLLDTAGFENAIEVLLPDGDVVA